MDADDADRREAYAEVMSAKASLERAANHLGYDNIHEMARQSETPTDMSRKDKYGVQAITNAYSYLDNGGLANLVD